MELRGVVESWIMISFLLSFYDIKEMNAEVFANDPNSVDCWPDLSDKL